MIRRLPWALFFYLALLVYGSLYPWHPLRVPQPEQFRFLLQPWPAFVTRTDLLTNVLIYVPFGFLAARHLTARRRLRRALPLISLLALALSTALECGQLFVPERVASNLDIATNTLGALLGAVIYGLARRRRSPGRWLLALRVRWFASGHLATLGLLLLALWLLPQFSLDPPSLIAGHLKTGFLPLWEVAQAPERIEPALAALYAVEYVVLTSVLASVLRQPPPLGLLLLLGGALFLAGKFLAATTLVKWHVTPRLFSLELAGGMAAGALSAARLLQAAGPAARWGPAGFALALALLAALLAGPMPLDGSARHFNVTGFAALAAVAWPWLAALYLGVHAAITHDPRH
ncbi:MAG: VanZ family protein [Burkholderiales bacterium]|nr:VanZ family protein [Burkholderiales bacterium]